MRRRKNRNRNNNKKRKLLFFSLTTLLLLFSVGYAAFSSNISLSVQGNIKYKNINYLKKKVTTTGDGLYTDTITNNRYIYRGSDPDNYILINSELFRIVAIETDNTLKVVSDESIGTYQYDDESRYSSNSNDYCHVPNKRCNIWGSKTTMLDTSSNHIDKIIGFDSSYYNLPENEASINIYLNRINNTNIISHEFNIGYISEQLNINHLTNNEKKIKWIGFIGLLNVSDIDLASLDERISINSFFNNIYYKNKNYLYKNDKVIATINMFLNSTNNGSHAYIRYTNTNDRQPIFNLMGYYANYNGYHIFPVTHLKSTIKFSGNGTKNNPFTIK